MAPGLQGEGAARHWGIRWERRPILILRNPVTFHLIPAAVTRGTRQPVTWRPGPSPGTQAPSISHHTLGSPCLGPALPASEVASRPACGLSQDGLLLSHPAAAAAARRARATSEERCSLGAGQSSFQTRTQLSVRLPTQAHKHTHLYCTTMKG